MPVVTAPDARPALDLDVPDDPRRLVLADLLGRLAAGVATQARVYETAAEQAQGALRQALEALARSKHAQAADLAPQVRALAVPSQPRGRPSGLPPSWGVMLGEAFQGERALERLGRDLATLATDPAVTAVAARLVAGADGDREEVRRLYLRYT